MKYFWIIFFGYLVLVLTGVVSFDPFTLTTGLVAGGSALLGTLGYNYDYVKENTYCRYYECCIPEWIPADMNKFRQEMEKMIFGQHIASKFVTNALEHHFEHLNKTTKPLVMSFHGTTGIGKTSITNVMKKAIYKLGINSKYVHTFNGRTSFPVEAKAEHYREELIHIVKNAVSSCPLSLFVFDEVDKMPSTILNGISSMLDSNYAQKEAIFNKPIYIFLSNTAGSEISKQLTLLMNKGLSREDTELHHFEKITQAAVANAPGAPGVLVSSGLIKNAIIDFFIPFLPLEQRHLRKCIEREFLKTGITPSKEQIDEILRDVDYDSENVFFAANGCKKMEKKVGVFVHSWRKQSKNEM
ncbi:Torsin [Sergentomyia squamirostris]